MRQHYLESRGQAPQKEQAVDELTRALLSYLYEQSPFKYFCEKNETEIATYATSNKLKLKSAQSQKWAAANQQEWTEKLAAECQNHYRNQDSFSSLMCKVLSKLALPAGPLGGALMVLAAVYQTGNGQIKISM